MDLSTKAKLVNDYFKRKCPNYAENQDKLYTVMSYARDIMMSLEKKIENLFCLREKHKVLPQEKMAKNLRVFLGRVTLNVIVS